MAGIEKLITNSSHIATQITQGANKGKIPRYLYHFTTAENFAKMQNDMFCYASSNDRFLEKKSIFMFDLMNFLKDWGKKIRGISLQEALLDEVTAYFEKDTDTLVLLRIPTKKLKPDNLRIRSQDVFLKLF